MKAKCFGIGRLNHDHDYLIIDTSNMEYLWDDKNIEGYFTNTGDSNKPIHIYFDWPFGNLTYEEAIIFRDLVKKIAKY
ncbi:MAG: hypothetical protein ULS35scaffold63_9 [Phage 33_17]|nr:MAG: hypothetical protein ULS35scaffold63_9 [Phage 33_17]